MTQYEFETRIKREVKPEDFDYINRIYMAAGEMDKDSFCAEYNTMIFRSGIVKAIVEHCEQLARSINSLNHAIADQASQLDAARHNMSSMQREIDGQKSQIAFRDEKILNMQKVQDAVEQHIDLEDEKEVREAFEEAYGKLYTIRMRYENSWELNDDEILWLIQHAEE